MNECRRKKTRFRNIYRLPARGRYCFRARDRQGRWVERVGTSNLETTERLRHEFEDHERLVREGLVCPLDELRREQSRRPVADVLAEFRAHMEGEHLSRGHVRTMFRYAERVIAAAGFTCLADVEPSRVERFLANLLEKEQRSFTTRNRYLTAIKALMAWAVDSGMMSQSPLRCLHKLNEAKDPRRPNRALTEDEFRRLIEHAPKSRYRAFYLVAGRAGLRWATISRLRNSHFRFEAAELDVTADIVKTTDPRTVPLLPEVISAVKAVIPDDAKPNDPVFGFRPDLRTWRRHLKLAGIPHGDDSGRIVDRKSLRKTFASHLIAAGVKPRELQLLMGHRNVHTTMRFYSDPVLVDTRGAIAKLAAGRKPPRRSKAAS